MPAVNDLISVDRDILGGKPRLRGTRISVQHVLEQLAGGATRDDIKADFGLTEEQIHAALAYALDVLENHHTPMSKETARAK